MLPRRKQARCRTTGEAGTNRQTIAQTFGKGDHIRLNTGMLITEVASGAAHAGLHLVDHQQPVIGLAQARQRL